MTKTTAQLIAKSVARNTVVHVQGTPEMHDALTVECEDSVQTHDQDGLDLTEYWGTTDDGAEWRIHVTQ